MTDVSEAEGWARGLDEVVARLAPRFGRVEPRRRASAYLRGLLAPLGRKNGWQLAEAAGDRTPDGMQDFLSRVRWTRACRARGWRATACTVPTAPCGGGSRPAGAATCWR